MPTDVYRQIGPSASRINDAIDHAHSLGRERAHFRKVLLRMYERGEGDKLQRTARRQRKGSPS